MGGYGAVKLALRFSECFVSAHSLSGALSFGHRAMSGDDARVPEFSRIVGANPVGGIHDLYALSKSTSASSRPALRIDCGVDDFLIEDNRDFHRHLSEIGYSHEYEEYPGAHNWEYWDKHVHETIEFSARHLGVQKVA
jgi:S-formylglutathione hydrolase FrmB